MTGLPDLLTEIADEAKTYDGVDQAVRVLRRRQRMRRLVPATMAAVVAAGLLVTYVAVRPGPPGGDGIGPTVPDIPAGSLPWLPQTLTVPQTPPPALPADRGVGAGSLIYQRLRPLVAGTTAPGDDITTPYLVTVDGGHYQLPVSHVLSLSPDGRWLLSVRNNHVVLRDLTGSEVKDLGAYLDRAFAAAWSSNSSRLAFEQSGDLVDRTVRAEQADKVLTYDQATVVDLPSGQTHNVTVSQFPGTRICGVQDGGDLILCSSVLVPNHVSVWLADGGSGVQRSHVTADLSSVLTDGERAAESASPLFGLNVQPLSGGTTLLVRTHQNVGMIMPDDLLAVDLTDGRVSRRLDLPVQEVGSATPSNGGVRYSVTQSWAALSASTEGVLLARGGPRGTGPDSMVSTVQALELLDPVSGQRSVVTTVSGDVWNIFARGTVSNQI